MRPQSSSFAIRCSVALALAGFMIGMPFQTGRAQGTGPAGPVFSEGQAQIVPAFDDSTQWIREELWVETEFDTDGDGMPDRVHVAVVRPWQTETEGLMVPIVYESSPYFSGTGATGMEYRWQVRHPVGAVPPPSPPRPSSRSPLVHSDAGMNEGPWEWPIES